MFKFAKSFAIAAFVGLGAVAGLAQPVQFDWTTTKVGYSAEITLDRPSSTDGGLSDIISASITTPDFGTINYTPATATLNGSPIVWSSTELTELILDWSLGRFSISRILNWLLISMASTYLILTQARQILSLLISTSLDRGLPSP